MKQRLIAKSQPGEGVMVEMAKPAKFVEDKKLQMEPPPKKTRFRWWWLLLPLVVLVLITSLVVGYGWWYINTFTHTAGNDFNTLFSSLKAGLRQEVFAAGSRVNILVLGLDEITSQREGSLLTDTMMVASVKQSGEIDLISIPRDLWIDSLKTKINALYYYGEESENTTGTDLTRTVVEDISGQKIHHYVVIKLDSLQALVDAIGGVNVVVEKSFVDTKFPRTDADITATDPAVLYETVSFNAGLQHLDGETALKFIRSRHSDDTSTGTDLARSQRQQQVVSTLARQILSKEVLANPTMTGTLYRTWHERINTDLTDAQLVALGKALARQPIAIQSLPIPVQDDQNPGLIVNPPVTKHNLWVYEPVDPSWYEFRKWFAEKLY